MNYKLAKTALTTVIIFLITTAKALAWDDCPFGEVNDEYPGECPRYIDTDGDGICDRSQPAPEDRESSETTDSSEEAGTEGQDVLADSSDTGNGSRTGQSSSKGNTNRKGNSPYNFAIPFFTSLALYLISWFTAKSKKIAKYTLPIHNAVWNTVLLLSLVPSAVFGFYLVLRYAFPEIKTDRFDFLYWHVEGSIVMGTVAIMHLVQRLTTYIGQLKLFGKLFK